MSPSRAAMLALIVILLLAALPLGRSMGHEAPCPDCLLPTGLTLCMALLAAALALPGFTTDSVARSRRRALAELALPGLDKPPRVV